MKLNTTAFARLTLAWPVSAEPIGVAHVPLPVDFSGTLNGGEYKIRVPLDWNATRHR